MFYTAQYTNSTQGKNRREPLTRCGISFWFLSVLIYVFRELIIFLTMLLCTWAQFPGRPEEGVRSPKTGITGSFELPDRVLANRVMHKSISYFFSQRSTTRIDHWIQQTFCIWSSNPKMNSIQKGQTRVGNEWGVESCVWFHTFPFFAFWRKAVDQRGDKFSENKKNRWKTNYNLWVQTLWSRQATLDAKMGASDASWCGNRVCFNRGS